MYITRLKSKIDECVTEDTNYTRMVRGVSIVETTLCDVVQPIDSLKTIVAPRHHHRTTLPKVNSFCHDPFVPNLLSGLLPHTPTLNIPRFDPREPPP